MADVTIPKVAGQWFDETEKFPFFTVGMNQIQGKYCFQNCVKGT